ncbi:hypothetical protein SRHO_G00102920 [Serrasalmus rhombeus]
MVSVYSSVQTLLSFSESVQYSDGRGAALLLDSDPTRLRNLVAGLVVCSEDTRVPRAASRAQVCVRSEFLIVCD